MAPPHQPVEPGRKLPATMSFATSGLVIWNSVIVFPAVPLTFGGNGGDGGKAGAFVVTGGTGIGNGGGVGGGEGGGGGAGAGEVHSTQ